LRLRLARCTVANAMARLTTVLAGAVLLTGCMAATTGPVVSQMSDLRTRNGACASMRVDSGTLALVTKGKRRIETCLLTGLPGTLMDDGKTPVVVTRVTGIANSPDADASNWQVEYWFNGVPVGKGKRMLVKTGLTPELSCDQGDCESSSLDVAKWPEPFAPGRYSFRYTCALDTSLVAINIITLQ